MEKCKYSCKKLEIIIVPLEKMTVSLK